MLRKIKIFLCAIIAVTIAAMLSETLQSYDNESLPNNPTLIEVGVKPVNKHYELNNTNKNGTKAVFFDRLTKFVKSKNISLKKLRVNSFNNQKSKVIYNFNKKQNDFSLYRNARVKQLTKKELYLEDVFGIYCTDARGDSLAALTSYLKAQDLGVQVIDNSLSVKTLLMVVLSNVSESLIVIFISVIGILFIIMLLEKIYRFKAYAAMKINGLSNWQIFKRDFNAQAKLLGISLLLIIGAIVIWVLHELTYVGCLLFLRYAVGIILIIYLGFFILDILSYSVLVLLEPYQAIKGSEKSRSFVVIGYLLKLILLALVVVNSVTLNNHLQTYTRDTKIIKKWRTNKEMYSLGLNWNDRSRQEERSVEKSGHQLIVQAKDVIISANSEMFHPAPRSTDPENGNVIIANDNFVKQSNLRPQGLKIDTKKITMLVPRNRLNQVPRAKKQLIELIKFQRKMPNYYQQKRFPEIEVKTIASGQKLFNYTVGYEITSSVSVNPIIIVINKKVFSDDYYTAASTRTMVQFPHLRQLRKLIQRFKLTPYLVGIISERSQLSDYNMQASRELLMLTVTTVLSLLQLIFIILFVTSTFLQNERHKMAVTKVFGKSNAKLTGLFLLANLGMDVLVIMLVLLKLNAINLMLFTGGYLLLEGLIIWLTCWHAERNLLVTLNHGN
ncbi:hypothetical protein OZX69_03550 [Lactobacillus sp. ESL0731]|uniref:hypothetical protein n=1 Tax=unclassified Lactobacillus TaxID=2620435 RepID=UPI0023F8AC31|nr:MULTISPECIES: hypothetical protein [unclassified Lactobacillus]WEV51785.1 hypothetical protein OZX63_03550 [Lactobacillus sp. ESL0700]WEV62914.1 hypothetical protein OZX69_03550 [Lactobacillus sp. ESL0731]